MLAKSRGEQSGLQLEVNERILDSCNSLMLVRGVADCLDVLHAFSFHTGYQSFGGEVKMSAKRDCLSGQSK
jgi:hypothetical protein